MLASFGFLTSKLINLTVFWIKPHVTMRLPLSMWSAPSFCGSCYSFSLSCLSWKWVGLNPGSVFDFSTMPQLSSLHRSSATFISWYSPVLLTMRFANGYSFQSPEMIILSSLFSCSPQGYSTTSKEEEEKKKSQHRSVC